MKRIRTLIATAALLSPGVASLYAQQGPYYQGPIKMTVSGTNVATTINLQPGTVTDEVIFGGNGTLGPFTYRELHADALTPQSSNTCVGGTGLYVPTLAGGGVFRFQDGSLLSIGLMEGSLCIDLTAGVAHFVGTYKINGGTGRFKSATGALTLNSTVSAMLFSDANAPLLLTNTGQFAGQISGVTIREE
jgi:hypothetical protein